MFFDIQPMYQNDPQISPEPPKSTPRRPRYSQDRLLDPYLEAPRPQKQPKRRSEKGASWGQFWRPKVVQKEAAEKVVSEHQLVTKKKAVQSHYPFSTPPCQVDVSALELAVVRSPRALSRIRDPWPKGA